MYVHAGKKNYMIQKVLKKKRKTAKTSKRIRATRKKLFN